MKMKQLITVLLGVCLVQSVTAANLGSEYTYQGELKTSGSPANGAYDFEFHQCG